jgi:hypothetical protein
MAKSIDELFSQPTQPPAPKPVQPSQQSGIGSTLIVAVLVIVLGWMYFNRDIQPNPNPVPDDKQEQKDKVEPVPKTAGKTLVFIHERNPQPIEHDLLLREMDKWTAERKLQYRALDDDIPDHPVPKLLAFAKSKGIESPFVALTDQANEPVRVIKWPAGIDGLQELIK